MTTECADATETTRATANRAPASPSLADAAGIPSRPPSPQSTTAGRCGIDTVEIARVEKLLRADGGAAAGQLFSELELNEAGTGPGRLANLAVRFAAKEACCKLIARETARGEIGPLDFVIRGDERTPRVEPSPAAQAALDRNRLGTVHLSVSLTEGVATAMAWAEPLRFEVPWFGKVFYYVFPFRRALVLDNMRRAFGDVLSEAEIVRLAQAYCGHFIRFLVEFLRLPWMSQEARRDWVRVENIEAALGAHGQGKGVLLLVGHFGNWEAATVAGMGQYPQYQGLLHFVRRPLKPKWFNDFVTRRFKKSGFGTLAKRGSLETILELLAQGAIVVSVFDQHAGKRDGIVVDFLGHPASTFKSLAILAMNTGAPVLPAHSWREPDGRHILRFEEPLPLIECEDAGEAIRRNTRAYNIALERMLLRHPEQWIWMHRRWKVTKQS